MTVQGVTLSQIHRAGPRTRPFLAPTPFDINTQFQRSLVKAIALHRSVLSIYAGEDLPESERGGDQTKPPQGVEKPKLPARSPPCRGDDAHRRNEWLTDAQLRFIKKLNADDRIDTKTELLATLASRRWHHPEAEVSRVVRALESKRRAA